MSDAIRIVLVDTTHPGNVGASARAMKNMGLGSLVLVRSQAHRDPEACARASGAADVLERARVAGTVADAISDCGLVLGATARTRSARWRVTDARGGARELVAACGERPAAILFGGERNGLANHDLERCQALVRIPVHAGYASLNLAQAVQIVCYEIRMALAGEPERAPAPAPASEMQALDAHLERIMRGTGFMRVGNAGQLGGKLRRLVARAQPDAAEIRILRGCLAAIERRLRPARRDP